MRNREWTPRSTTNVRHVIIPLAKVHMSRYRSNAAVCSTTLRLKRVSADYIGVSSTLLLDSVHEVGRHTTDLRYESDSNLRLHLRPRVMSSIDSGEVAFT